MRTVLAVVLVLAVSSCSAYAQSPDVATREDVIRLMEVFHASDAMTQMGEIIVRQLFDSARRTNPNVPNRALEIAREVMNQKFSAGLNGPTGLVARMVPIYAKYLTHSDIAALIAFYQSEVGKKALSVMPAMMQEGSAVGAQWATEMMPDIQSEIVKRLQLEGITP
jgi:uncharacterized protein